MLRKLSTIGIASLFVFTLGACKKDKASDKTAEGTAKTEVKKEDKAAAKAGIDQGNPKLAAALKAVLDNCEVSEWGYINRKTCKDPNVEKELKKQEKMVGLKEALTTYCYGLSDKNHLAIALSSYRISTMNFATRMSDAADKDVFQCLLTSFNKMRQKQHVQRLARAVTYMGTALNKDKEVLDALEKHPVPIAKVSGYGALWANGRLRVFPTLEKAIKDTANPKLQIAAIKSFSLGSLPKPDEQEKVCGLLMPFMTNDNINIAESAAFRVASVCKTKKDEVIKAAKTMIGKKKFSLTYVTALRTASGWLTNKATPAQQKEIIAVLKTVLKTPETSALTRSTALSAIHHADKKEGKKIAKKYVNDKEKWVAKEAARILSKK